MPVERGDWIIIEGIKKIIGPIQISLPIENVLDAQNHEIENGEQCRIYAEKICKIDTDDPKDGENCAYDKKDGEINAQDLKENQKRDTRINLGNVHIRGESLLGLKYNEKYAYKDKKFELFQVEQKEVTKLTDRTENKYALKRKTKQDKPFEILPLTPLNFFKSLQNKQIGLYSLASFSFLALNLQKDEKIIIFDQRDLLISFTAYFKGLTPTLLGLKNTAKTIGQFKIELNQYEKYKNTTEFHTFMIVEQIQLEILYRLLVSVDFKENLIIYRKIRSEAEEIFEFLLNTKKSHSNSEEEKNVAKIEFVNVQMKDFLLREFTIDSFHPTARGDWNEGYVITAKKIN